MSSTRFVPDPAPLRLARAVARETGITEQEALELVFLLRSDRSSLLFQARALKKSRDVP